MMDDFVADRIRTSGGLAEARVDVQKTGNAAKTGDDALLLGDDGAGRPQLGVDGVRRCNVFERLIFQQGMFEDGLDSLTLPVHTHSHDTPRLHPTLSLASVRNE